MDIISPLNVWSNFPVDSIVLKVFHILGSSQITEGLSWGRFEGVSHLRPVRGIGETLSPNHTWRVPLPWLLLVLCHQLADQFSQNDLEPLGDSMDSGKSSNPWL